MNKRLCSTSSIALAAAVATIVAGCASTPAAKPDAVALLAPASGSQVSGTVSFRAIPGGLRLEAEAQGLPPGPHGFHIHEVGDCSTLDATSAKGHFNPYAKAHGSHTAQEHHAGDMPNLTADAGGKASWAVDLPGLSLGAGEGNVLGRAVVIHADADDYKTQPAGNSGKRIACGVIKAG